MGTFPFNFRETLPLKDTLVKTASNHNTDTTFRYIFTSARLQATNDLTLIVFYSYINLQTAQCERYRQCVHQK